MFEQPQLDLVVIKLHGIFPWVPNIGHDDLHEDGTVDILCEDLLGVDVVLVLLSELVSEHQENRDSFQVAQLLYLLVQFVLPVINHLFDFFFLNRKDQLLVVELVEFLFKFEDKSDYLLEFFHGDQ